MSGNGLGSSAADILKEKEAASIGMNVGRDGLPDANTIHGSASFSDAIQNPMFQKYMMQLGQGMTNQPTLGQGIQAGLANASQGLISGIADKQAEDAKLKLEDERQKKLLAAMKSYGLGDFGSLSTLASNPKLSGLLQGLK